MNTMTPETFRARLQDAVASHAMLQHPFYQLWSEGKLSQATLGEYAKQYYAQVQAFPTYVSAVHSHCDDLPTRQMLLENLLEEEQGPENHPELWLRFAEGLGITREAVKTAQLLPQTTASVCEFKRLTQDEDYRVGLAALYAYESQIPAVARTKREGLKEFYNLDDARAVSFFTVHEYADVLHQQVEIDVLSRECVTGDDKEKALAAAGQAAQALWGFLDGVQAAYIKPSGAIC